MTWLVDASLRFRRLILAVAAGVLVVGVIQVGNTSTDALPEFSPPMVEVQTEALGLSAEEVEQLITVPLEQDLLAGVPFLESIESTSMPGLSSVVMVFEPGTELLDARQVVQERLTQAVGVAGLPDVSRPPQMIQPLSSNSRVAMLKLSSEDLTPIEVSVLARWVIGPRLLSVPGVANVVTRGNRERQLQVHVDPARLAANGATLEQVVRTAGNALEVSPLSFLEASTPGTGGFIDTPNQRLNIFHEQAIKTADELAQVPLEGAGARGGGGTGSATLGDVTDVVEDHQPLIGDTACAGGEDCLLLVVEKFPDANTVEVTEGVEDAVAALQPGLADITFDSSIYRPASFVESSFSNLGWALLAGALLLLIGLYALFWDWRRWLTSVAAIAVSFAAAVVVLQLLGTTVDLMVTAGLVVGLSVVVSDAVLDVDAVARRLRRRESNGHKSGWQIVVESAAEVRRSVLYAALVVAAASLPLFFLDAEGGAFLPPVALAYLLAVAVSMLVAVTVTPALSVVLLTAAAAGRPGAPLGKRGRRAYDRVAPGLLTRAPLAAAVALGVLVVGLIVTPFLDTALRPALDERDVLVHVEAAPGTSLPKMTGITDELVQEISGLSGVDNVGSHVGRAMMADQVVDVNSGEVWVHLASDADFDDTVASIESTVGSRDDVTTDVLTYSEERVADVLGGSDDQVIVRAYGEDPEVLDALAEQIQPVVADVDGVSEVTVDRAPVEAAMQVEVDLDKAEAVALKPGDVRRAAASLLGGITVGNLFDDQKVFDVVVWGAPSIRNSEGDVEQLLVDTPSGDQVRLGSVADVRIVDSPTMIRHEAVSPYLDVVAEVSGADVSDVQADLDDVVSGLEVPREHHAEVITADGVQTDQWQLIAAGLGALFAILLVLQAAFGSWRLAGFVLLTLPVSLVGGLVAVLLTGGTITIGAVAGLLAVLGIAARQVVVLIRHYQHLQRHWGAGASTEIVLQGTKDCLASTLTSALAIALVLTPFAVLGRATGFDIIGPMALVVIGGLVTTTLVTLFVVPALYPRLGCGGGADAHRDLFDDVAEQRGTETTGQPAGAMHRRATRAMWPVGILALLGTACGGAVADEYVVENDPGHTEKIKGTHKVRVVLEQSAADRLQIDTSRIERAGKATGTVVPSAAVFVGTDGQWWVYTTDEPLEYMRHKIDIVRQTGSQAFLSSGPPPGTEVVTVGVAELFGVEAEVGH